MNANELLRAGELSKAIQALSEEIRQNPLNSARRTFLFELLCFAGEWDRGEKQLNVLAQGGKNAELGALMYRAALHAERERQQFFKSKAYQNPSSPTNDMTDNLQALAIQESPKTLTGTFNGRSFQDVTDADPRIGPRLEVYVAGRYLWVPFEHIASIEIAAPKRLRDLLWAPAVVLNGSNFKGRDLGDVLVPVLSPFSCEDADDAVRLGRATVWQSCEDIDIPFGQKMLLIDGEEVPLLELRNLKLDAPRETAVAG